MACGTRLSNLGKLLIFLRGEIGIVVVLFKDRGNVLALFRGIESPRGDVIELNGVIVELPGNQEHFAETIEPGALPAHEAGGNEFIWHGGVSGSEWLELVQGNGVADRPGQEHQQTRGHSEHRSAQALAKLVAPERDPTHYGQTGYQNEWSLGTKERAKAGANAGEGGIFHIFGTPWKSAPLQQVAHGMLRVDHRDQKNEYQRSSENGERFREWSCRVVCSEGAERREPKIRQAARSRNTCPSMTQKREASALRRVIAWIKAR